MQDSIALPGPIWGGYPTRNASSKRHSPLDLLQKPWHHQTLKWRTKNIAAKLDSCNLTSASNDWPVIRSSLRQSQLAPEAIDAALLAVLKTTKTTLGWQAFNSQIEAALLMVEQYFAELATGEGKSLAMALAACVLGLAGSPVHLMTANEYLAQRDAQLFEPLYRALGLSVGSASESMSQESLHNAFANDITYTTARCVGFAFLRDRIANLTAQPILRGLCCGLIDEADVTLLDEARTPLVISQQVNDVAERTRAFAAIGLARALTETEHWEGKGPNRRLTKAGLKQLAQQPMAPWLTELHRHQQTLTALHALHDIRLGKDYLIREKCIELIDVQSGRVAQGRQWGQGLHAMVAVKEGQPIPKRTDHIASITYPRLLERYQHLAGLSGTLINDRAEIQSVYRCPVVSVNPHHRSKRLQLPIRGFTTESSAMDELHRTTFSLSRAGRPVLIATQDINQTRRVQVYLESKGLRPSVLSAENESLEAAIVMRAGGAGAITIATQLAGRGTDIKLDSLALKVGGLAVISLQMNQSARTDRQIFGRAARQGQPGSAQLWVIESELVQAGLPIHSKVAKILRLLGLQRTHKLIQSQLSRKDRFIRHKSLENDRNWSRKLIFSTIRE